MVEKRRYARAKINASLFFSRRDGSDARRGIGRDIALGGMFIETDEPQTFGAEVVVRVHLPGAEHPVDLPAVVRWVRDGGMGVQFGLLGARETHLITELNRDA